MTDRYRCPYCHDEMVAKFQPSHEVLCGVARIILQAQVNKLPITSNRSRQTPHNVVDMLGNGQQLDVTLGFGMTIRTTVRTIGPVDVIKVEAELLPTPTKYVADCNECGWGYFQSEDQTIVEMEAQAHLGRNHVLYDQYDDVEEL